MLLNSIKTTLIIGTVIFLSACFGERPEGDKYPDIPEFPAIERQGIRVEQTPYNEFGTAKDFHFATERPEKAWTDQYLTILNKNFEVEKRIELPSEHSKFAVFENSFFIINDSHRDSIASTVTQISYPDFEREEISFISRPLIIYDSILNTLPDSIIQSFTRSGNTNLERFDSLYCNIVQKELKEGLRQVYEIYFPAGGRYFILDYGKEKYCYKEKRMSHRKSCFVDFQNQEMLDFKATHRIKPFDKAFTEWTYNSAVGGSQKSGYQYFKLELPKHELKFKKYLGQYFHQGPQYYQVYRSDDRDSILLQECGLGTKNTIHWIINK